MVVPRGRRVAPDLDVDAVTVAVPQLLRAGAAEQVLPELRVLERLLVSAEDFEDRPRGDKHQLALGPAQGHGEAARIEQELAGNEQVFAVAFGGADQDHGALAALEPLDSVDR